MLIKIAESIYFEEATTAEDHITSTSTSSVIPEQRAEAAVGTGLSTLDN